MCSLNNHRNQTNHTLNHFATQNTIDDQATQNVRCGVMFVNMPDDAFTTPNSIEIQTSSQAIHIDVNGEERNKTVKTGTKLQSK